MIISVKTKNEYVPEWNGNKDDESPITIEHLTPTMALYEALIPKPTMKMNLDKDGRMEGGETEVTIDNRKIVVRMVTGIKNLTLNVDGKPIAVTSGSDLFGPAVPSEISGLVDEIGAYLQGLLSKKAFDAKN